MPFEAWSHYKDFTADTVTGGPHADFPLVLDLGTSDLDGVMDPQGLDLRVTNDDGSAEYDFLRYPKDVLSTDFVRTWFSSPVHLYSEAYDKSWLCGVNAGAPSASASWVKIVEINHATNTFEVYFVANVNEKDDHNNGGLALRSDGRLVYWYSKHNDTVLRYRVSTNAGDASAWGSEVTADPDTVGALDYSYSNPYRLSSEGASGRIYNFYRYGTATGPDKDIFFTTSDDDYATAPTSHTEVWSGAPGTPYVKYASNGTDRIDVLATPKHPNESNYKVCHFYYDGSWKESDGTALTLPAADGNSTTIFDGTATGDRAWVWDIQYRADGNPHVLFSVFPNDDGTDHRYYYSRFNGTSWTTPVDVTGANTGTALYAGEAYYSGGCCLDPDNEDVIYLSQRVSTIFEIQEWTTSDDGGTWAKRKDITSGSAAHNFRPNVAKGMSGKRGRLTWLGRGLYTSYTAYHTTLCCYPPLGLQVVARVPSLTDGDTVRAYVGNPAATDGQATAAEVYPDDLINVEGVPRSGQQLASMAVVGGTANGENRLLSDVWPDAPLGVGQRFNSRISRSVDRIAQTGANHAGRSVLSGSVDFEWDGTTAANHTLMRQWDGATKANLVLWITTTGAVQLLIVAEANTQVTLDPSLTVTANTPSRLTFSISQSGSGWSGSFRLNGTLGTDTDANTANFDATTSATTLVIGKVDDNTGTTQPLRGGAGNLRLRSVAMSDDYSATYHTYDDGSALTAGTLAENSAGTTVTPNSVSITFSVPTPTVRATVKPDPVVFTFSAVSPTIRATAKPDPVSLTFSTATPSVRASVKPDPVAITFSVPTPTLPGQSVTVTPDPVSFTFSVPTPRVLATVKPSPVSMVFGVTSPSIRAAVRPDPVVMTFSTATPSIRQMVSPSPVVVTFSVPTPTIGGAASATPDRGYIWTSSRHLKTWTVRRMRTELQTIAAIKPLLKHTSANRVFGVDLTDYCDNGGVTITDADAATQIIDDEGTEGDLTLGTPAPNTATFPSEADGSTVAIGKGIQLSISGGTAGNDYRITVPFTDSDGEADAVVLVLKVRDAATYTQE